MPFSDPERRRTYSREYDRRNRPGRKAHAYRPSARGRFVAVDGEGWGKTYALLADSENHAIADSRGLSTPACLTFLSELPERCGKAVYFGFSLGYDINHWLKDVSSPALYSIWADGQVRWEDWWLQWAPGRWFHVKHIPSGRSVRVYDIFPFFQASFLKACAEWGVAVPESVRRGKAERQTFSAADLDRITSYNREELETLVRLAGKLRDGLYGAGIELLTPDELA